MISLVLAALLAQDAGAPDAGLPSVEQLYVACGDAPLMTYDEDAGNFIVPLRRQQRNNCKLVACETYADAKLKEEVPVHSNPGTVLVLVTGAIVLFGGGIVLGYMLPHAR